MLWIWTTYNPVWTHFMEIACFPLEGDKTIDTMQRTRSPALGFGASQKHKKFPPFSGKKQRGGHVCRRHRRVDTFVPE